MESAMNATAPRTLVTLAGGMKDYARDTRLNVETVLSEDGAPGLSPAQLWGTALACAYATQNPELAAAVQGSAGAALTPEIVEAAKAAATIMAMNNVYYRFLHLAEDKTLGMLPAKLRMTVIGRPGIPKVDFELMSLAISALAGCGMCINAHIQEVRKAGVTNDGIQSAVRIAAVLNAAKQALAIG
jgi:lipoyl-dependent peroxiredoxin subunit D